MDQLSSGSESEIGSQSRQATLAAKKKREEEARIRKEEKQNAERAEKAEKEKKRVEERKRKADAELAAQVRVYTDDTYLNRSSEEEEEKEVRREGGGGSMGTGGKKRVAGGQGKKDSKKRKFDKQEVEEVSEIFIDQKNKGWMGNESGVGYGGWALKAPEWEKQMGTYGGWRGVGVSSSSFNDTASQVVLAPAVNVSNKPDIKEERDRKRQKKEKLKEEHAAEVRRLRENNDRIREKNERKVGYEY